MTKRKDLYEKWVSEGKEKEMLELLTKWSRCLIKEKEMALLLGITPERFSVLKKKHVEIQQALDKAKLYLKQDLVSAMYKKALGYDVTEEEQFIESGANNQKPKTKIHKTKRHIQADYNTQAYLMNKFFGKEYNANYDNIELQQQKLEDKEVWSLKKFDNEKTK